MTKEKDFHVVDTLPSMVARLIYDISKQSKFLSKKEFELHDITIGAPGNVTKIYSDIIDDSTNTLFEKHPELGKIITYFNVETRDGLILVEEKSSKGTYYLGALISYKYNKSFFVGFLEKYMSDKTKEEVILLKAKQALEDGNDNNINRFSDNM
jgi:hypothetical protein